MRYVKAVTESGDIQYVCELKDGSRPYGYKKPPTASKTAIIQAMRLSRDDELWTKDLATALRAIADAVEKNVGSKTEFAFPDGTVCRIEWQPVPHLPLDPEKLIACRDLFADNMEGLKNSTFSWDEYWRMAEENDQLLSKTILGKHTED